MEYYVPEGLTKAQVKAIIKAHENYGIGVAFQPSKIRQTIADFARITDAGYARHCSTWASCNAFFLTEKALEVVNANS